MELIDVYEQPTLSSGRVGISIMRVCMLYELLREREPQQSISHREMPTYSQHFAFVESRPYSAWYTIRPDGLNVGAIYLSKKDEVGVGIFKQYQGRGYGPQAVKLLMEMHPRPRYLANINPENVRSRDMFELLGFKVIQQTLELRL